MEDSVAGVSIY